MQKATLLRERKDRWFKWVFRITGLLVIGVLGGIFLMLLYNSIAFFGDFSPLDFISGSQ